MRHSPPVQFISDSVQESVKNLPFMGDAIQEEIEKTTKTFKLGNKSQEHNLIDSLKIASRRFTKEKTGKKPFTNINLVKI